ncbi:cystathionine beta-lyase [Adhaeribacter aerolatus]|uniref:Cystathionine beta-lyase n=1 Tax=Adhaeribacter aerolatus TaxID=670289 RepID=A0A512B4E8_9BACT|nr:aminotransferase class I/II-fold pyridoxal phosphate-dependent enzyme [Adhaeribacter aerolatus]GEO06838.1 cystathionine beta-lyase [Adhaeribacter aerolatus]
MAQHNPPIKPKVTPIYQTSVFTFDDLTELEAYFEQPSQRYMYARYSNPNANELAEEVNKLEQGDGAVVTSSGMSAIFAAILLFCQAGDHVLCAEEIYGGSSVLLNQELNRMGITVTYVPVESLYNLSSFTKPNTKLLLAETMSNPLLRVLDIAQVAAACHQENIKLVIDNTFASPIITQPLALGADAVIHSVTKYLAGHSDVTAGIVVTKGEEQVKRIRQIMMHYGLNLSPFESWLAVRGLKTLRLRIKQHSSNALTIAQYLSAHPKVNRVYYPGLAAHPDYELAKIQGQDLFGGMLSFAIADDEAVVNKFMQSLPSIPFAPSLAGVSTSISHPVRTSHRSLNSVKRDALGITMGVIRLSVGVEEPEEILAELKEALKVI